MNDRPEAGISAFSIPEPIGMAWLDGDLFSFLQGPCILDIKAPGDPDQAPVARGATVATHAPGDAASAGPRLENNRFDSIFSRCALGFSEQPERVLAQWLAALLPGGHMVMLLPHAGGAPDHPASRAEPVFGACNAAPRKGWDTVQAVTHGIERALEPGSYKIVLANAAPARRLAGGVEWPEFEIRVVLQKLTKRSEILAPATQAPPLRPATAHAQIGFTLQQKRAVAAPGLLPDGDLLVRDFSPKRQKVGRILVLKLDHHGDFVIGLPALRELRATFPESHIRLVCGSWNVDTAKTSGVADEVRPFNFFPERGSDWTGKPVADLNEFDEAAAGRYDLAIDLRVDEDTRDLLGRVDAELRCGIGSQSRYPMMQIALPDPERANIYTAPLQRGAPSDVDIVHMLAPDAFQSTMRVKTPEYHETEFLRGRHTVLRSGEVSLPAGRYTAEFDLTLEKFMPAISGVGLYIEVTDANGRSIATHCFGRRAMATVGPRTTILHFNSAGEHISYRFQVITEGKALSGRLRFSGLRVRQLDAKGPRFQPSELHVGEKLSLLVALVRQRVLGPHIEAISPASPDIPGGPIQIIVAPFSNSTVRDWPLAHYARLIALLVDRYDCRVEVVGAPAQTAAAERLMASVPLPACAAVINRVGKTQWTEMRHILPEADLVICNNSGIAHQAASLGARTLAIYSGSHQPMEWGPRGPRSRAIMMGVPCSPCGFERIEDCPHDHVCMQALTPEMVAAQVAHLLAEASPA